jgi:hypothetical protein
MRVKAICKKCKQAPCDHGEETGSCDVCAKPRAKKNKCEHGVEKAACQECKSRLEDFHWDTDLDAPPIKVENVHELFAAVGEAVLEDVEGVISDVVKKDKRRYGTETNHQPFQDLLKVVESEQAQLEHVEDFEPLEAIELLEGIESVSEQHEVELIEAVLDRSVLVGEDEEIQDAIASFLNQVVA